MNVTKWASSPYKLHIINIFTDSWTAQESCWGYAESSCEYVFTVSVKATVSDWKNKQTKTTLQLKFVSQINWTKTVFVSQ